MSVPGEPRGSPSTVDYLRRPLDLAMPAVPISTNVTTRQQNRGQTDRSMRRSVAGRLSAGPNSDPAALNGDPGTAPARPGTHEQLVAQAPYDPQAPTTDPVGRWQGLAGGG